MDGVAAGGMFTKWVGFRWADDGWAPRELVLGCVAVATFFFKIPSGRVRSYIFIFISESVEEGEEGRHPTKRW